MSDPSRVAMRTTAVFLAAFALFASVAGCERETVTPAPAAPSTAAVPSGADWLHGSLDERFDKVSKHLRGLDMAMAETGYRYTELHWAGEDRNWGYALYQIEKMKLTIANGIERRPKRAASTRTWFDPAIKDVEQAARREDPAAFRAAFDALTASCNLCHQAEKVPFVTVSPPATRGSPVRWKQP